MNVISKYREQAKGHFMGYLLRFIAVMIFHKVSQNYNNSVYLSLRSFVKKSKFFIQNQRGKRLRLSDILFLDIKKGII